MPDYDRMFRMESVPNALEQPRGRRRHHRAARRRPGETPWQWSTNTI